MTQASLTIFQKPRKGQQAQALPTDRHTR